MIDRRVFVHFDWVTFAVTLALTAIGFATVYSATFTRLPSIYQREPYWIAIGVVLLLVSATVSYALIERFAYAIYGETIVLLASVFLVGKTMGGARRWLDFGLFSVQPSEIAKVALVIIIAKYFSERTLPKRGLGVRDLVYPFILLMVPFALIAKQPDLGTAIILWLIFWSMMFALRIRARTVAGIAVLIGAVSPFAWASLKAYQKARLLSFINPGRDPQGSGYHVLQSKIAIGSGGVTGKGFADGTQGKLMFLPEHHTDFIFSVFAEEWGFIGSAILLALFMTLLFQGLSAAEKSKDRFGFLLAFGISSMFFWHIIINLGMVSGLLPVVGVPLPFISYGGSFLVTSMIAVGLIINVKMRRFMF